MPRKGLNRDIVIDAAISLIEKQGNRSFSLNELARSLDVKTTSLYNYVDNMDELIGAVGLKAAKMIKQAELDAIDGKRRDDALFSLCTAYRRFALEHVELYRVVFGMQKNKSACTKEAYSEIIEPIIIMLSDYNLDETAKMHWQRILRALMHGFFSHEYTGGFTRYPVSQDETYLIALKAAASGIHNAET